MSNSLPIVDLSTHGDTKNKDVYMKNAFSAVKGDGANGSEMVHKYFGILSTDTSTYELSRLTVSESSSDSQIGTLTLSTNDGTSLTDTLSLSSASTVITTDVLAINGKVETNGILQSSTIQFNTDTGLTPDGSQIDLIDSDTAGNAALNFSVGLLSGALGTDYYTPLSVGYDPTAVSGEEGLVAIEGTLTVNGTDLLDVITNGNPWEIDATDGSIVNLKNPTYGTVRIGIDPDVANVVQVTSLALDLNGTLNVRGNDILMYDEANFVNYSVLNYTESTGILGLRASRSGDTLNLQSEDDAGGLLSRMVVTTGTASTATAYLGNVGVFGVGYTTAPTPISGVSLDVLGSAVVSGGLTTGGDVDVATNNVVNVTNIDSDDSLAEQARVTLTSHATVPQVDITVGDLATAVPTVTVTEDLTTIVNNVQIGTSTTTTTILGDLTVTGTTTTVNAEQVDILDQNITLASGVTDIANLVDAGISLGDGGLVTLQYVVGSGTWESSHGITLATTTALSVDTTTLDTNLTLGADDAFIFIGATNQWRIGVEDDAGVAHFTIAHNDGGLGTYVTKLDIEE